MKVEVVLYQVEKTLKIGAKAIFRPESAEERETLIGLQKHINYPETTGAKLEVTWSWERIKGNHERNERRKEAALRSQEAWQESMRKDWDRDDGHRHTARF